MAKQYETSTGYQAVQTGAAGLAFVGSLFAAQNIKETAALNREIAEMNAEFAELDAYDSLLDGETQKADYQKIVDQTLGQQRANLLAADVDVSYGSAASIAQETKFTADLNKFELEKRAQETSLGYTNQARQYRHGGALNEARAESEARSVVFQGGVSALESGAKALSGY